MINTIHFAENIVRLRHEREITQEELAGFIGVTKASVSKWETKQSMPDILLLPQLASFFDVTVDELLGYEPQLGKEQIRAYYHRFAADFAQKDFEEVMKECEIVVKKYYSCYRFLIQMCILWLNHYMMAESRERQQEILDSIDRLCGHILKNCKEISICNNAVTVRVMVDLFNSRAENVVDALEDMLDVNNMEEKGSLLMQAYFMTGAYDKADKAAQINMYRYVMQVIGIGTQLLTVPVHCKEKCEEIIRRMDGIIEIFDIEKLNPNVAAGYHYQAAVTMSAYSGEEAVFERLERYVRAVNILFDDGIVLHGDSFFTYLDEWFEGMDLGSKGVRNRKLVEQSALEVFAHPVIAGLKDKKRLERLKASIKFMHNGEK